MTQEQSQCVDKDFALVETILQCLFVIFVLIWILASIINIFLIWVVTSNSAIRATFIGQVYNILAITSIFKESANLSLILIFVIENHMPKYNSFIIASRIVIAVRFFLLAQLTTSFLHTWIIVYMLFILVIALGIPGYCRINTIGRTVKWSLFLFLFPIAILGFFQLSNVTVNVCHYPNNSTRLGIIQIYNNIAYRLIIEFFFLDIIPIILVWTCTVVLILKITSQRTLQEMHIGKGLSTVYLFTAAAFTILRIPSISGKIYSFVSDAHDIPKVTELWLGLVYACDTLTQIAIMLGYMSEKTFSKLMFDKIFKSDNCMSACVDNCFVLIDTCCQSCCPNQSKEPQIEKDLMQILGRKTKKDGKDLAEIQNNKEAASSTWLDIVLVHQKVEFLSNKDMFNDSAAERPKSPLHRYTLPITPHKSDTDGQLLQKATNP